MKNSVCVNIFKRISLVLIFGIAVIVQAAPGDLDTTFGGTGKIRTLVGGGADAGEAVVRQTDGKIIVAGTSENGSEWNNFSLVRYNANGTLDTTFGSGGKVLVSSINGGATAVAVFTENGVTKIVVAGYTVLGTNPSPFPGNPPSVDSAFMVAKFNADGTPDTTFDGNGIVFTDFGASRAYASAVAVQTDGKIIAAGRHASDAALARYNTNGSLDTTFDGDGKLTTGSLTGIYSIGIQSGKIVAAGGTYGVNAALVRFNSNGSLDTSFDGDGVAILDTDNGTTAYSLAFLSTSTEDQRIIVTGTDSNATSLEVMLWSRDAVNGAPDTTIGTNGKLTVNTNVVTGIGKSIKLRTSAGIPDRILIAGDFLDGSSGVVSLFMNGAVDTNFGSGGVARANFGTCEAMLVQPSDNRIVVAGFSPTSSNGDFATVRFNSNGTLDATFSGDGKRAEDLGNKSPFSGASSTLVQTDGKIVVAGDFAVTRFNPDGTFDSTFDNDGKTQISSLNSITGAAIQTDGKIVVSAFVKPNGLNSSNNFLVYRFNPDGSPDATFDGDGAAAIPIGNAPAFTNAVGIQSDGGIIVAGFATAGSGASTNRDFAAARILPTGALDTAFGVSGKTTTPIGAGNDAVNALKIQPDDKIVVAGSSHNGSNDDFAVVRYNPDGSLDNSFSFDGKQTTQIGAGNDVGNAIAIQAGKIVVSGSAVVGGNNDFAVARYNDNGSLDTTFDTDGKATTAVGAGEDVGNALAIQTDGKILVAGSAFNGTNNDFAVVRYNADGSLDNSYGNSGKVLVDVSNGGSDNANGIALDSIGRAVVVGDSAGLFGVARILVDALTAFNIEGLVSYGTTPAGQPTKYVAGVNLNATGASSVLAVTDGTGNYQLSGLINGGNYTVTPSKTGDVNSISSFDASLVARRAANLISLTPNQMIAADASNNGSVSSFDASLIARTAANVANTGIAGQWKFAPASRNYPILTTTQTAQNYEAILMGEVSGNWTPPSAPAGDTLVSETAAQSDKEEERHYQFDIFDSNPLLNQSKSQSKELATNAPQATINVALPTNSTASNGTVVLIPVTVGETTGQDIFSFDLTVSFNQNVLTPANPAFDTATTVSGAAGFTITPNTTNAGQVTISGFGTQPLSGQGTLIFLRFNVVGTAGTASGSTNLTFASFVFNEGEPQAATTNGAFRVTPATAANVSVGGRVTNAQGRGIRNVVITMTDSSGNVRTARTTGFGYYRFTDVAAGETYVFTATGKRFSFGENAQVHSVTEDTDNINFVANEQSLSP